MDVEKARTLARAEMRKWGLLSGARPWLLRFNRSRKALGRCSPKKLTITLSTYFFDKVSEAETLDTIKHEVAHALEAVRHGTSGHGVTWKAIAVEVGANPVAKCRTSITHPYPYVLKYGDEVVKGFWKMPKLATIPLLQKRGVPESLGKLKLYRVTYKSADEARGA